MKRVLVAAALAALAFAAPAHADRYINLVGDTTADGRPTLMAHPTWDRETLEVFRCPGGGACDPQPLGWIGKWDVDLRAAEPGDVFEARLSEAGTVVATRRTVAWTGTPALVSGPGLEGTAAVGATLSPVGSQWSGGWGPPSRSVSASLILCRQPTGTDCMLVSYGSAVVLPPAYAGWYAFVTSSFSSGFGGPIPVYAAPPFPVASVTPGPTVAGPLGPISAPPAAPKPQPVASLRAKALRANGRLSVGRVTCPVRCTVNLTVSGGGTTIRRTLTVTGLQALTIAPRHGRLKVTVAVEGKTLATGKVLAR